MAQQHQRPPSDPERIWRPAEHAREMNREDIRPWLLGLATVIAIAATAAWWTEDAGLRDVFIAIGGGATAIFAALVTVKGFLWLTIKLSRENRHDR